MNIAIYNHKLVARSVGLDRNSFTEDIKARHIHIHHKPSAIYLAGYEILLSLKST